MMPLSPSVDVVEELIGSPHNLVRHPHMPQAAFRDLWTTIKAGRPWEGLVKNRAKSGDFYWVRANVTPVVESGMVQGFISIRTKPTREEVAAAERSYAAIREGQRTGMRLLDGALVPTGFGAWMRRVTTGITSGTFLGLGILIVAIAASLIAGTMGVGVWVRALALFAVSAIICLTTALAARRMRNASRTYRGAVRRPGAW